MRSASVILLRAVCAGALSLAFAGRSVAAAADLLQEVVEQNRRLQEQVRAQQRTIEELNAKMTEVLQASARHERELRGLQDRAEAPPAAAVRTASPRDHEVRVAAEAGLAYFDTGADGQFPEGEFRADDPVISIEAPVKKDVYFFAELKLLTREANSENFQLGELYVDFENVSAAWGRPGLLGIRAGRFNIPFGEEYLTRGPVANPLISHSLGDIWGVDEGLAIYGRIGPASYVLAVQNGGVSRLRDFNGDKALVARVGWDAAPWLYLSGSAMRTGELATTADGLSEVWFGNGFFRALGPVSRTGTFWANLFEVDAIVRWKGGHVGAAVGHVNFDDSDTGADNSRRMRYGHVELVQALNGGLYAATRYSEIRAPRGYPLAGWGPLGRFFFSPLLTESLRRLSVGMGYRFADPLVLKIEYAWESGRLVTGARRENGDFFGSEIGLRF